MNKAELIEAMANGAGISKADAKKALDAFVDSTTATLKKGDVLLLLDSDLSLFLTDLQELAVTHKLVRKFKSLLRTLLSSRQVLI